MCYGYTPRCKIKDSCNNTIKEVDLPYPWMETRKRAYLLQKEDCKGHKAIICGILVSREGIPHKMQNLTNFISISVSIAVIWSISGWTLDINLCTIQAAMVKVSAFLF